jgi:two-component system, sensor histidine kinase and response regulator
VLVVVRCDEQLGHAARLSISVTDTGIGIPESKHATIFEAFSQADGSTTRRFGGTGLGLTISSTLVRLMGGRIWVESQVGEGSTFHFTATFPLADVPERHYHPLPSNAPVLIVDDNDVNRAIFVRMLTRWQLKPTGVNSGPEALAALSEAARAGRPYALVLLDANMPDMDGFTVAERMGADRDLGGTTIMMLSSSGQFGDSNRCRALGIRAYLTKPIRQAELFDALCDVLHARPHVDTRAPETVEGAPLARLRILLAEDNRVNQRVAVGLLTRRGHAVDVVDDGALALAALEATTYDVVLMDIQMPNMGGVEATQAIREREMASGRRTRIVAMTAHAMKGDRERYLACGMDGYLSKPIDPAALFAAVEVPARVQSAEAAPQATLDPAIDLKAMRRRLGNDEQLIAEVIGLFRVDCPVLLQKIGVGMSQRDATAVHGSAHALKGAAGNLSAHAVADCASVLEHMANDGQIDAPATERAWARLQEEAARLLIALDSHPFAVAAAGGAS